MNKQLLKILKENNKTSLILFYADWCGHCKEIKPFLKKFVSLKEIDYVEIDSDNESELQETFDIQYLPTAIFLENKTVFKLEGPDRIKQFIKNYGK